MLTIMETRNQYAAKIAELNAAVETNTEAYRVLLMQDLEAKVTAYKESEQADVQNEIDKCAAKIAVLDEILAEQGLVPIKETDVVIEEEPIVEIETPKNPLLSQISAGMATKIPDRPGMTHITVPTR